MKDQIPLWKKFKTIGGRNLRPPIIIRNKFKNCIFFRTSDTGHRFNNYSTKTDPLLLFSTHS